MYRGAPTRPGEQPPPPGRTPRLGQGWPGGATPSSSARSPAAVCHEQRDRRPRPGEGTVEHLTNVEPDAPREIRLHLRVRCAACWGFGALARSVRPDTWQAGRRAPTRGASRSRVPPGVMASSIRFGRFNPALAARRSLTGCGRSSEAGTNRPLQPQRQHTRVGATRRRPQHRVRRFRLTRQLAENASQEP